MGILHQVREILTVDAVELVLLWGFVLVLLTELLVCLFNFNLCLVEDAIELSLVRSALTSLFKMEPKGESFVSIDLT